MSNCELCNQGDPSITVRCWNCRETFHLHKSQLDMAPEDTIVMGDCPGCGAVNCWMKAKGQLDYAGPVLYLGQPTFDLRGKR